MTRISGLIAVLCLFALVSVCVALPQDYSADVIVKSEEGNMSGKISVTTGKIRMEMNNVITITRMDRGTGIMLMPAQKIYMEQPFNPRDAVATQEKIPGELERTLMGRESVDGREADKYKIVYETAGQREAVFQWIDLVTGIPIKTESEDGKWIMEYKNLKVEAQPASLFEVPDGYQNMNPSAMMASAMAAAQEE